MLFRRNSDKLIRQFLSVADWATWSAQEVIENKGPGGTLTLTEIRKHCRREYGVHLTPAVALVAYLIAYQNTVIKGVHQ